MLQVARLSPQMLGDSTPLVADFLASQQSADGGFRDREGKSDVYYTAFGIQALLALQAPLPVDEIVSYLTSFDDGDGLDLVHLACLARCWASIPAGLCDESLAQLILTRIETHRTPDGGYTVDTGASDGTVYGCFLALGAYEDLGRALPNPQGMLDCIGRLRTPDGGYANGRDMPLGLTPPSAAAESLLRHLGHRPQEALRNWLLGQFHPEGGFLAADGASFPDLLSTATALHALAGLHADLQPIKEPCLDFIDTLWTARGGFYGNWEDDQLDCEYTYYGLLALGHLSL